MKRCIDKPRFQDRRTRDLFFCLLLVAVCAPALWAQERKQAIRTPEETVRYLTNLSIEELMNLEVTTVSRRKESWWETAAAVHVITQEDIRRSGAKSIPEALRLAPGVQVARITANRWAIAVRGFNSLYAAKLLVQIDGRTVYSPLFAGTYWEVLDTFMDDIERIEVVRGPGAAMWGANAVNGVINIITKDAMDTQGGLLNLGGGTTEHAFAGLRYGGRSGENIYWRVYGKSFDRDGFTNSEGGPARDDWGMRRGGGRMDWAPSGSNSLSIQGDLYTGTLGQLRNVPKQWLPIMSLTRDRFDVDGGSLQARWTHDFSPQSDLALQFFVDRSVRREAALGERRTTADLDFQHRLTPHPRHELLWGAGYRYTTDRTKGSFVFSMDPHDRADSLFSFFLADKMELLKDRLRLTVGTRVEHNDYSGWEFQPTLRLLWTPNPRNSAWAAVSRAVQTPSRATHDMRINILRFPLGVMSVFGNDKGRSEDVLAWEVGYRTKLMEGLYVDTALFLNVYHHLRTREQGLPFLEFLPPPLLTVPLNFANNMSGKTYGGELCIEWQPTPRWRLEAGYSFLQMQLGLDPPGTDVTAEGFEDASPHHQVFVSSQIDLPHNLELDTSLYYVDHLPFRDVSSYVRLDARLGWHPTEELDLAVGIQNLSESRHIEYNSFQGQRLTQIPRSVYWEVTWRF